MPINTVELLSLVTQLCEEKNLRVPIKESLKGGLLTFATTALGGLLAGPVGLAIGGTVGGVTAGWMASGKFKSVAEVIMNDLTVTERERLANSVMVFLRNRSVTDLADVTKLLLSPSMKMLLLQVVIQVVFTSIAIVFKSTRGKPNLARALEDESPPSRI